MRFCLFSFSQNIANGKIKIYFNKPVNNAVSNGINAVYLNKTADDTLVTYINRAKKTLDIAVYNYSQTSNIANIANAVNAAYTRGVKVRWIYDGSQTNLGLPALNSGIPKLASPTSASYGIMHNKFMVIDANSSNTDDSYVWTGSSNWSEDQIFNAVNNFIIIQDQPLAKAYLIEFNEMWGDTGMISNASNSKFGPDKSNNSPHNFTVGGVNIELYFSPSDQTNKQILASINSADKELFFGVYTFTDSLDATAINAKYNQGLNVYGIIDSFSVPFRAYNILSPVLQTNLEVYDIGTSIYHSKMLLVDPNVISSDPLVLTGSHNWSKSADTKNDENTLIIHDATVANIYYQSFSQNFKDLGGVLPTAIQDLSESTFTLYPNPSNGNFTVTFSEKNSHPGKCELYDLSGRMVLHQEITSPTDKLQFQIDETVSSGTYFIHFFPQGSTQLISIVK